ncbi:unnamed protein product, partial [Sphenostylis stenocarpa]
APEVASTMDLELKLGDEIEANQVISVGKKDDYKVIRNECYFKNNLEELDEYDNPFPSWETKE